MKKFSILFSLLILFACNSEQTESTDQSTTSAISSNTSGLSIDLTENSVVEFENLRIYPIVATPDFIEDHDIAANFKNLKEGIAIKGFRITEKKPYGRFNDSGAVNNLTVQNKSQDTIYLMAGDIVKGGKQDRVIAEDMVVAPRTITDIPVFCVEQGRWDYQDDGDSEENPDLAITNGNNHTAEQNKKVFAFTGYYNVASNDLRKVVKNSNNQGAVWAKVNDLTSINNASSNTSAYTALEESKDFTDVRDFYIESFSGKFAHRDDVVGMIAVSGDKVLGVDVFTHPNLFKKQYEVLIHSYITEAISNGKTVVMTEKTISRQADKLLRKFDQSTKTQENSSKQFFYKGKLIHYTDL